VNEFLADSVAVYLAFFKHLLFLVTVLIFVFNIDELFIDALYLRIRLAAGLDRLRRRGRPLTAADLIHPEPDWIALFVPARDEADVIGPMLRNTLETLDYPRYRILVGTYPDDPATEAAVRAVAARDGRVVCIVGRDSKAASSKAANLNVIHDAMLALERAGHPPFKAVVLHDAEDVVHRMELHVFNRLIPALALVQLPVEPLPHERRPLWGHAYLEEFAESHSRDMVVRHWLGASLPSAGVGCGLSRAALAAAARQNGGKPFRPQAKTEDYELGIALGLQGFRTAMVRLPAGPEDRRCVATRSYFPDTFQAAVRQRSRWLLGITLNAWRRFGWPGRLADRYMLLRDRKALPCAFLNVLALFALAQLGLLWLCARLTGWPGYTLVVAPGSLTAALLDLNLALLAWRAVMRAVLTGQLYGVREGLLSVPRALCAILIQAAAAWRALETYAEETRTGKPAPWDKTAHRFLAGHGTR